MRSEMVSVSVDGFILERSLRFLGPVYAHLCIRAVAYSCVTYVISTRFMM